MYNGVQGVLCMTILSKEGTMGAFCIHLYKRAPE